MAVSHFLLRRKSAPKNLHTNFRCLPGSNMCMYACMHGYALPSEARQARSEATRVSTAKRTYHKLKTAHNID